MTEETGAEGRSPFQYHDPARSPRQEFRPVQIETTRDLDLTGLSEDEADALRRRALGADQDAEIVANALGIFGRQVPLVSRTRFVKLLWGKWLQFPQVLRPVAMQLGDDESVTPPDVLKESLTRVYNVEQPPPETEDDDDKAARRR